MKKSDKNNNILFLTRSLNIGGGIQRAVSMIGRELDSRGWGVQFKVLEDERPIYDIGSLDYSPLDKDGRPSNPFSRIVFLFSRAYKLAGLCREKSIPCVISHGQQPGFISVISKVFGNSAKVITCVQNNPKQKMGWKSKFLVRMLYPFADKVVAVSKGIERYLKNHFSLENTTTIYNPVAIHEIQKKKKGSIPPEYQNIFSEDGEIFINVASLTKQKGQWHLIRAFKQVVKENPNVRLIILGEGELRGRLKALIEKCNLQGSVFLLGNQENVFPFLRASDYFVLSSLYEGLGIVLLEALACRLPVVSSDCNYGPGEIMMADYNSDKKPQYPHFTDVGVLTKPHSPERNFSSPSESELTTSEMQLADQMLEANQMNISNQAQTDRLQKFKVDHIASRWEEIIKD